MEITQPIRDYSLKSFLLATIIAITNVSALQAETRQFGNAVSMATLPGIKLSRIQRSSLKQYRSKKSYFGAFYVVQGTDLGFWTRNFHDFDIAKSAAKKGCEIVSKGGKCELYALVYPKGLDPNAKGARGTSQIAAKTLNRRYPKEQKTGKYGAFALNKAFGFGYSFGWDTEAEAKAAALEYCKVDSSKALAPLGIEARKWARQRGLEKCQIIDTHTPE